MSEQDKVFLTAKETAEHLGISKARVAQLRKEGKLTGTRWGIWLYRRSEVDSFKKIYKFNRKKGK